MEQMRKEPKVTHITQLVTTAGFIDFAQGYSEVE